MIRLRKATIFDFFWWKNLRSIPIVYQGFYTQTESLTFKEHFKWWFTRDKYWHRFIIEWYGRRVGILNVGYCNYWSPEIGYAIHPSYWHRDIATKSVAMALQSLKERGYGYTHTTVLKNNIRSLNMLSRLGYLIQGEAREGEWWLTKRL
jgi:RimJ/RimL family protein N-acetyltransferase